MKSVIRKYALVALCGTAIIGFSHGAQAASWNIVGGGAPTSFAGYGTGNGDNNVVNNLASGVFDTNAQLGSTWVADANLQATFATAYNVSWFYAGSESDNTINFTGPGVAVAFPETDINNNCASCATNPSPQPGQQLMGTAINQNALTPLFTFTNTNNPGFVTNGANNPDNAAPPATNFLLSYAIFDALGINGPGLYLTDQVSDWVVIGLNDTGAADDNHDDFMVAAFISETPREQQVPIPGALPLFASVLGGGFLFRKLRNRRQAKAGA